MAADLTRRGPIADPAHVPGRDAPAVCCLCEGYVIELFAATRRRGRSMLVLTRKSNQSIMIGDEIEISVLSIMGEKVRIGIQAPREIPVFRKEVYLEIQAERGQVTAGGDVEAALRKLST
jgi:carbon storage regulator